MSDRVRITEVSPRDGLQNEPGAIPMPEKAALIRALLPTGVDEIEATSFVSPRWVPQLGDAAALLGTLGPPPADGPIYSALVPNEQGLDAALAANGGGRVLAKVAVFTAASETFSRRNTNATVAETIERFRPVVRRAQGAGLLVRGYISCAFACPFEGPMAPRAVAGVAARLWDLGVDEISLGDTIGAAEESTVGPLLDAVRPALPARMFDDPFALNLHLHDTFGRAGECVRAALRLGIRSFDGSVAGLGGCPYASAPERRAPGNIDTLLLVRVIREAGFECGVDEAALGLAAAVARGLIARARGGGP